MQKFTSSVKQILYIVDNYCWVALYDSSLPRQERPMGIEINIAAAQNRVWALQSP
jgi:hypothetical protein